MGHAVEEALTVSGQWDMWGTVLSSINTAARAQGDIAEQAWVLHQLGTRSLLLGDRAESKASLSDALDIRERVNDVSGAAVTRHNLDILLGPLPPEQQDDNSSGGDGAPAPAWLKIGIISLVGVALTALLIWYFWNPNPPQPVVPPKIASFSVSPSAIPANSQAQLCYEVENADSVRIEPNIGERKPAAKECLSVTPSETLTYTLTAFAADGKSTSQRITLNVEPAAPEARIVHFEVHRDNGPGGAGDVQFRLCYEVRNAAHAEIDNNGGTVVLNQDHCQQIAPQQTTIYTLTATGNDGRTVTRQATADATRPPVPRPQILSFKASPERVVDEGTAQLCFRLKDASGAQLDPGALSLAVSAPDQCVDVRPFKTTTYTLKAFNSEGVETSDNTTITVVRSPKIVEFSVNPQRIARGDSVSLCFRVENTSSVGIEPRVARNRPVTSSERICVPHQPRATTTYATAFGEAGLQPPTRPDAVTVDEPAAPPVRIARFEINPTIVHGTNCVTHWRTRAMHASSPELVI